jgi:hypothetical protein
LIYEKISAQPIFLDYISFDGNSWIDVDYIPSSNTRVVGKVSFTQWHPTAGANYVFGVFGGGANFGFNVGSNRGILNVPWGTNSGIAFSNANTFGQVYSFDISKNGAYIDGVLKLTASQLSATFTATKSFFVGWANGTGTQKLIGDIYPMQMYENDVLVKDLRPCLDPNGAVCLYDMVTKKYHYNIGTGTIKAGNVIPDVAHTEIEYLEGDSVSYINTGVIGRTGVTIDMHVIFPTSAAGNTYFIGCAESSTQRFYTPYLYNGNRWSLYIGNSYGKYGNYARGDEVYHIVTEQTTATKMTMYINDKTEATNSSTVETNYPIYLFGVNNYGTPLIGNSYYTDDIGYIRIQDCKMYVDGELVRDYVAVEKSDGVKCLYDKVDGKYYEFQTA